MLRPLFFVFAFFEGLFVPLELVEGAGFAGLFCGGPGFEVG
jgi:hypothetical protein